MATKKKVAKKLSKKWKTMEPTAGQEAEGSEVPKRKKAKVLEEDADLLVEAAVVTCKQ